MHKKDYELIAEVIKFYLKDAVLEDDRDRVGLLNSIAQDFAFKFTYNPKFDRQKFLTACGIGTMTIDGQPATPKQRDWVDGNIPL